MNWYYAREGQQTGPVDDAALNELVRSGVVREDTLVWHEGMQGWQPYGTARGMAATTAATGGAMPAVPMAGAHRYGGFWIRFVARVIDVIIVNCVQGIFFIPIGMAFGFGGVFAEMSRGGPVDPNAVFPAFFGMIAMASLIGLAVGVIYEIYFLTTRAATPGKMVLGLKVIRLDGAPISTGLAAGRFFARWLSSLILYIGYIIAAFDAEKRALHDHICSTRVIYAR